MEERSVGVGYFALLMPPARIIKDAHLLGKRSHDGRAYPTDEFFAIPDDFITDFIPEVAWVPLFIRIKTHYGRFDFKHPYSSFIVTNINLMETKYLHTIRFDSILITNVP
jgi:hypothetical protein